MNIGKDNRHPKYICDKCKTIISYQPQKGFDGLNKYYKQKPLSEQPKRNFDLCNTCEKEFREWLNTPKIPTQKTVIEMFPVYEEE